MVKFIRTLLTMLMVVKQWLVEFMRISKVKHYRRIWQNANTRWNSADVLRVVRSESGMTLVSVLIIILLLTILGAGLIGSAIMENKLVHTLEDQKQALYLAQAGVEYARFELQKDLDWRVTGYTEALGNGQFRLQVDDDGTNQLKIITTGIVGRVQKTLEVGVNYTLAGGEQIVQELAQYTVVGGGNLIFENHAEILGSGDLRSNSNITFTGNPTVNGSLIARGNIDANISPDKIQEGQQSYPVPAVDWDKLQADALATGQYLMGWQSEFFRDGLVNYIDGDVEVSQKGVEFTLDGILVIRGDLVVETKTEIRSNSGLMIFVDGDVSFRGQTYIDAAIYATGTVNFRNNTEIHGAIYSNETVRCENHTTIVLEPTHLLQMGVAEVLVSTGEGASWEDSMGFIYWKEL